MSDANKANRPDKVVALVTGASSGREGRVGCRTRSHRAYGHEDRMGYHCHEGPYKLRADDWEKFMDFADAHWKGAK